jgi:LemA protein
MAMHEERIRRMAENGVISATQAEKLLNSVKSFAAQQLPQEVAVFKRPPYVLFGTLAILILVLSAVLGLFLDSNVTEVSNVKDAMNDIGGGGVNKMVLALSAIIIIAIIPIIVWVLSHNSLVSKEEQVIAGWAQVESNYQRRSDLIPELVESVSRYLKHEKETLGEITENRSRQVKIVQDNLNELINTNDESLKLRSSFSGQAPTDQAILEKMGEMEEKIGLGMRRIIAVIEDYPELRSSEQFVTLQAQLEGTENRINVARIRFNDSVREYNSAIRRFPASLIASAGSFKRKAYFKAEVGADKAAPLNFQ